MYKFYLFRLSIKIDMVPGGCFIHLLIKLVTLNNSNYKHCLLDEVWLRSCNNYNQYATCPWERDCSNRQKQLSFWNYEHVFLLIAYSAPLRCDDNDVILSYLLYVVCQRVLKMKLLLLQLIYEPDVNPASCLILSDWFVYLVSFHLK